MQIYLRTLGATELEASSGTTALSTREAALLAYVCHKPNWRASRTELVALFWPDADAKRARHSLSQLVYALRVRIPDLPLTANAETIAVTGLDADLLSVTNDVAAGQPFVALSRYKGRFLPTDDLPSEVFRDWRDGIEEEIALALSDLLQEQSHICGAGSLPEVIQVSELILSVHPHITTAQIALIESTVRTGQLKRAQRLHRRFTSADPEQASMLPPLGSFLARSAAYRDTHSAPFTGRDDEMGQLLDCWHRSKRGEGQVAVVFGEPGIGKTRLADQFLRRVAIQGGGVWIASCCAATQRLPYSVANELIRDHTDSRSVISASFLETGEGAGQRDTPATSSDQFRYRLTESLTSHAIWRSKEQPLAILIDDAQWADEYTSLLIAYWSYRLREERVMLLLTVRTQEAEPPPDWILADLGRPLRLHVRPISVSAAENIVSAFEHSHNITFERNVRDAVLWQSGGRPFLLLEALASLLADGATSNISNAVLSEPAESLLLRRFHNLPAYATTVVAILAVWGKPMSTTSLQSMSGLTPERFTSALNVLHTRGIAHLHASQVSFPHDLMRETAYRSVLPATRALNHNQAANELITAAGPAGLIAQHYAHAGNAHAAGEHSLHAAEEALTSYSYSDYEYYCRLSIAAGSPSHKQTAALRLGHHLVQVGRTAEIEALVPYFGEDSGQAKTLRAVSQLDHELASGQRSVTSILREIKGIIAVSEIANDPVRATLLATLFDVAFDAGAGELVYEDTPGAWHESMPRSTDTQLQLESVLSVWHGVTRDVHAGLSMARATVERLSAESSPTTRSACLSSYGSLLLLSGHVALARTQFEIAYDLACDSGDIRRQLSICLNNGVALMEADEMGPARHSLEKVVTNPNVHFRIRSYTNLAMLHYEQGDWTLAAQAAEAVLSMNKSYESPSLGSISHALLGLIALGNENYKAACVHASRIREMNWDSLDDTSYTATFLSQVLLASNRQADAVSLLSEAVQKTRKRDILCTMRLRCEEAAIVMSSQPSAAYSIARAVELEAKASGAISIYKRAHRITSQLRH